MSLCNFRTFTVILVFELAVLESQVESFTIHRSVESQTDPVPSDLITLIQHHTDPAKRDVLEVLNDLKSSVKPIEVKTSNWPLTVPIQTTAKTEEIQKNDIPSITTTDQPDADTKSTSATISITEYKEVTETSSGTNISTEAPKPSPNITTDFITPVSQAFVSSNMATSKNKSDYFLSKDTKEQTTDDNKEASWSTFENVQEVTDDYKVTTMKSENQVYNIVKVGDENLNSTNEINNSDKVSSENNVNITQNVNNTSQKSSTNGTNQVNSTEKMNDTNRNGKIKNFTIETTTKTEENNVTSYSTEPVKKNDTAANETINNSNDGSQNIIDNTNNNTSTTAPSKNSTEKQVEAFLEVSEGNANTTEASFEENSGVKALPYWKKYITIERKRANTTKDSETITVKDHDLLQSGTAQTQTTISLEKALNIVSDIPSLEQLKNDLIALNKMSSTTESTVSTKSLETKGTAIPTGDIRSSENTTSPTEAVPRGINIVSSKRAGYLDFSSRLSNGTGTTQIQETSNVTELPWNYSSPSQPQTTPKSYSEPKSMTSQSQLVDDAINEELMKEEVLLDNVENAKRLQEDRFRARNKTTVDIITTITTSPKTDSSSSEDKLRVKPISVEKIRNGSIYTVNPNYKPLKKIEVQPPKPFVRNPDDNSWRNESLSSLGIVFKANNSSKPFTQVLKNKTETELNYLLENNNKGDEPELRTRLEKIAEIRKTKKKKVNALGETVYTDYEESNSVENSNSSNTGSLFANKSKDISSFLDQVENKKPKTTTTRGYNFDAVELTTNKAQKPIDEYEDEDDEDYTLPNIDIKKYFTPTSVPALLSSMSVGPLTSPPLPLTVQTFSPDRRPTVQYFPPRDKPQKVVINDYDTGFQHRINAYTKNAPPKITIPAPKQPATEVTFDFPKIKSEQQNRPNDIAKRPQDKNIYLTQPPQDQRNVNGVVNPPQAQDVSGYNEASYVIKHLRDFIEGVVKADEAQPATEEPLRGVTANNVPQENPKVPKDYYDYEAQFRKDTINRFVENFNQNSERFKVDFPILYNTSVVHSPGLPGSAKAESTAFMKRLYDSIRYDPNCDRTVELSPAYELHYYVPEQEEKEVVELKQITNTPHRLRL